MANNVTREKVTAMRITFTLTEIDIFDIEAFPAEKCQIINKYRIEKTATELGSSQGS